MSFLTIPTFCRICRLMFYKTHMLSNEVKMFFSLLLTFIFNMVLQYYILNYFVELAMIENFMQMKIIIQEIEELHLILRSQ